MLETLRNAAGTWVAKLLLSLLVVSFAIWGISGQLVSGFGGNDSVVTAGGTTVSINEYRLAYDRQLAVMSQQFGPRITREQAKALGIDDQVLAQLVAGAVLDEQARKLGLGLSQGQAGRADAGGPGFPGSGRAVRPPAFEYVLRQVGMRPEDYLKNRAQVAIRQQIVEAVSDGIKAPDTFLHAVALYRGEDRTVEYLALPKSLVEPIEEPTDACSRPMFEDEQEDLRRAGIPQDRLCHASSRKTSPTTRDHRRTGQRRLRQEQGALHHARDAHDRAARVPDEGSGQDGARSAQDAARPSTRSSTAEGKTPADTLLGTFAKDKVADQAVAEAAFALKANEVSPVVQGAFGPVLLRVTEIKPEVVKPLDEVPTQIRKDLALARQTASCSTCTTATRTPAPPAIAGRSGRQAQSRSRRPSTPSTARRSGRTAPSSTTCRNRRSCSTRRSRPKPASRTPPLNHRPTTASSSTRSKASRLRATGRWTR